eukprot:m.505072 g.505072  ORF g.505072 m.505072 type:complete len:198 (+) comp57362_c0_seq50:621-1214(+)
MARSEFFLLLGSECMLLVRRGPLSLSNATVAKYLVSRSTSDMLNVCNGGNFTFSGTGPAFNDVLHGSLMLAGWLALAPLGTLIARYLKPDLGPRWFTAHRALQMIAAALILIGFAYQVNQSHGIDSLHGIMGVFVFVLLLIQLLLGSNLFQYKRRPSYLSQRMGVANSFLSFPMQVSSAIRSAGSTLMRHRKPSSFA